MMVYICGPLTMGGQDTGEAMLERIETAELVAAAVMKLGHAPVLTHSLCRHREALESVSQAMALASCFRLIRACDAIALIRGWKQSEGCRAEVAIAAAENTALFWSTYGADGESYGTTHVTGDPAGPYEWTRERALRILGGR